MTVRSRPFRFRRFAPLLLAVFAPAFAGGFPTGDYHAGKVTLSFSEAGTFEVSMDGKRLVRGIYAVAGNAITLTDQDGPQACAGETASGDYTWKLDGTSIVLTKTRDACDARAQDLAGHPWSSKD